VNGQREEILAGLDALGGGDGAQDDGFAHGGEHGAIGLTGDAPGLELQRLSAEIDFHGVDCEH
jgi:hypothetical protein